MAFMPNFLGHRLKTLYDFLATDIFFGLVLALLLLQSLWIALSISFPLPFDEYYHLGLINLYAHQWTPFISHQPASAAIYGDTTRNTSYLYHYLLSFPYRIIEHLTSSFTIRVILVRLINIFIFTLGVFLFKKVLLKLGLSRRLANCVLLLFVLVPLVPLLAATINYDNLLFVLIAVNLLLAINVIQSKKYEAKNLLWLFNFSMLACLVKFTFLPIFIAIGVYLVVFTLWRDGKKAWSQLKTSFTGLSRNYKIILILVTCLVAGLFLERYGLNLVRYHTPQPDCIAVQSYDVCKQYSPWYRNHVTYGSDASQLVAGGPIKFTKIWVPKMINDAFIAFTYIRVDPVGLFSPLGPIVTKEGYSIPKATAKVVFAIGTIAVLFNLGKLWGDKRWRLVFFVLFSYTAVLWLDNYLGYKQVKRITAVQPRYMLILAPLALAAIAQTFNNLIKNTKIKAAIFLVVLVGILEGGGVTVFMLRSNSSWYWPSPTVTQVDVDAKNILKHVIWQR